MSSIVRPLLRYLADTTCRLGLSRHTSRPNLDGVSFVGSTPVAPAIDTSPSRLPCADEQPVAPALRASIARVFPVPRHPVRGHRAVRRRQRPHAVALDVPAPRARHATRGATRGQGDTRRSPLGAARARGRGPLRPHLPLTDRFGGQPRSLIRDQAPVRRSGDAVLGVKRPHRRQTRLRHGRELERLPADQPELLRQHDGVSRAPLRAQCGGLADLERAQPLVLLERARSRGGLRRAGGIRLRGGQARERGTGDRRCRIAQRHPLRGTAL